MQVSLEWFQPSALIFQVCDALSPLVNQYNNRLELDIDNDAMGEMHTTPANFNRSSLICSATPVNSPRTVLSP